MRSVYPLPTCLPKEHLLTVRESQSWDWECGERDWDNWSGWSMHWTEQEWAQNHTGRTDVCGREMSWVRVCKAHKLATSGPLEAETEARERLGELGKCLLGKTALDLPEWTILILPETSNAYCTRTLTQSDLYSRYAWQVLKPNYKIHERNTLCTSGLIKHFGVSVGEDWKTTFKPTEAHVRSWTPY